MNMQLMVSVLRVESSITLRFRLPAHHAAATDSKAPTAELSTRLVTPLRNSPIMTKKMASGRRPARSNAYFSARVICARSSAGSAGPMSGCSRQRT